MINGRQYLYPNERRMLIVLLFFGSMIFLTKKYISGIYKRVQIDKAMTIVSDSFDILRIEDPYPLLKNETQKKKIATIDPGFQNQTQNTQNSTFRKKNEGLHIPANYSFDPNTITLTEMKAIGLPVNVANNIDKYRQAGGQFYHKKDLLKIYGMDSLIYKRLDSSIEIQNDTAPNYKGNAQIPLPKKLDLNTVSAKELMTIKGIGPGYSSRIIKYRSLIGYYASTEQLKEVYGMDNELYDKIKDQLYCSAFKPSILINQVTGYELSAHPYIDYKLAKIITSYREQHGPFDTLSDLKNLVVLNDSIISRIGPYLNFRQK